MEHKVGLPMNATDYTRIYMYTSRNNVDTRHNTKIELQQGARLSSGD